MPAVGARTQFACGWEHEGDGNGLDKRNGWVARSSIATRCVWVATLCILLEIATSAECVSLRGRKKGQARSLWHIKRENTRRRDNK